MILNARQSTPLLRRSSNCLDDLQAIRRVLLEQTINQRRTMIRCLDRHIADIEKPWKLITIDCHYRRRPPYPASHWEKRTFFSSRRWSAQSLLPISQCNGGPGPGGPSRNRLSSAASSGFLQEPSRRARRVDSLFPAFAKSYRQLL